MNYRKYHADFICSAVVKDAPHCRLSLEHLELATTVALGWFFSAPSRLEINEHHTFWLAKKDRLTSDECNVKDTQANWKMATTVDTHHVKSVPPLLAWRCGGVRNTFHQNDEFRGRRSGSRS